MNLQIIPVDNLVKQNQGFLIRDLSILIEGRVSFDLEKTIYTTIPSITADTNRVIQRGGTR